MIKGGPIGETETRYDTHWDEKGNTKLSHIFFSYNSIITSIQFGYTDNGALVMSPQYGRSLQGDNFKVVKLKHNEFVTGLTGVMSRIWLYGFYSLTFHTNLRKNVLICDPVQTSRFYTDKHVKKEIDLAISDRREFGGFFGSCSHAALKSIGIYMNPIARSDTATVKRENV